MRKHILIIMILTCLLPGLSCNNNPTGTEELKPGRRDYVWTVDTLDAPDNFYFRMWGSSPTDVWTVSSSNWEKSIAHFNGEKWSLYEVVGLFNQKAIYGFSRNNIFMTADQGSVWRYDGTNWTKFEQLTKDGHSDIVFDNIWGESSNNFFAFGAYPDENGNANNAVIAHFYNGSWEMLNTNELYGIVEHLFKNFSDNKIYLQVIGGRNFTDSTHIYEYSKGKYTKLYSNIWTKGLQADISLINGEVYFVLGNEVAIRRSDMFKTILKVDNQNFYQRIWGRNSKDIFLLMTDGLAHYDGNNIEYLFHFNMANATPWTQIYGAALFEKDVFFLVDEPPTNLTLIYHGKLKD